MKMRTCVLFVSFNVAVVLTQARNEEHLGSSIYENVQDYVKDLKNTGEYFDDYDLTINGVNGVHFNRHRPHYHHQNVYSDYESIQTFGDIQENPVIGNERNDVNAKLRFYFTSMDDYKELPINEAKDIFSTSWYNANRTTVFFAHGFTGHPKGPAVTSIINAYLNLGNHNVILLNWDKMAAGTPPTLASTYINFAMPNARKLGVHFAQTLKDLSCGGMDLNRTHFIGHSLGAHIFGIAGNTLRNNGIQLPWITGLDPAAYGFENRPSLPQLTPTSAAFVAVIHSDPSKYGFRKPLGTVDFWLNYKNGAVYQPGCLNRPSPMFSPTDLCNHNRSWQLLVDSLMYPGTLLASYAKNVRQWKSYSKEERNANVLAIGVYDINAVKGNYFLTTNAESPYGRGRDGL